MPRVPDPPSHRSCLLLWRLRDRRDVDLINEHCGAGIRFGDVVQLDMNIVPLGDIAVLRETLPLVLFAPVVTIRQVAAAGDSLLFGGPFTQIN
ncbi:hypothetical protein S510_001871 [Salmonella enterica subsp. arizonae]|nr:hypothetical protein [Salmonella enterica subsp. arizonae]